MPSTVVLLDTDLVGGDPYYSDNTILLYWDIYDDGSLVLLRGGSTHTLPMYLGRKISGAAFTF
jgi:hypothetical protein